MDILVEPADLAMCEEVERVLERLASLIRCSLAIATRDSFV